VERITSKQLLELSGTVTAAGEAALSALLRALPELEKMRAQLGMEGRDTPPLRARLRQRTDAMEVLLHAATVLLADHAALLQHTERLQLMAMRKAAATVHTTQRELLEVRHALKQQSLATSRAERVHRQLPWQPPGAKLDAEHDARTREARHAELRQLEAAAATVAAASDALAALLQNPTTAALLRTHLHRSSPLEHADTYTSLPSNGENPYLDDADAETGVVAMMGYSQDLQPAPSSDSLPLDGGHSTNRTSAPDSPLQAIDRKLSPRASNFDSMPPHSTAAPAPLVPQSPLRGAQAEVHSVVLDAATHQAEGTQLRRYVFTNNDSFDGQYNDGQRSGLGVYCFASGDRYEGQVAAPRLTPPGTPLTLTRWLRHTPPSPTVVARHSERLSGVGLSQFMRGEASGSGVYVFAANKGQYKGQWLGTAYEGYGMEQWAHGSSYMGLFHAGAREGFGVCR